MVRDYDQEAVPQRRGPSLSRQMRVGALLATLCFINVPGALGDPLPGGTLDPTIVPQFVTPLVIPPVMNQDKKKKGYKHKHDDDDDDRGHDGKRGKGKDYQIAVRQFQQQILPGGIWNNPDLFPECPASRSCSFPPTTVWSYGPEDDPLPDSTGLGGSVGVAPAANSQFNYPAYTFETKTGKEVDVRWINDLKENFGKGPNFLPHLLPIDQTLHWANPTKVCVDPLFPHDPTKTIPGTDCKGIDQTPYMGPVPIITHVHGAHVKPDSDGYPEAWYLPKAKNIPSGYATHGKLFDDVTGKNYGNLGYADFRYQNDQPATTLWYHDHSLGMTRSNVYAGPAGFWLVRGGKHDLRRVLPGPAPKYGEDLATTNLPSPAGSREKYREIPIVIQDRSFNLKKADGSLTDNPAEAVSASLFYPFDRAFFEGLSDGQTQPPDNLTSNENLDINFQPKGPKTASGFSDGASDVAPIWNPEAFFNVMVVNGVSWPKLDVAQAKYRFRLLNGCNSRFLNLSLREVKSDGTLGREVPFYQIGAEQGFLPEVVKISTGYATPLPGGGATPPDKMLPPDQADQALLMGLAERADVIVDFKGKYTNGDDIEDGTIIRMINTAPDEPFGGFPVDVDVVADEATTGRVMQFVVTADLNGTSKTDPGMKHAALSPYELDLPAEGQLGTPQNVRQVSLNEKVSEFVCVEEVGGKLVQVAGTPDPNDPDGEKCVDELDNVLPDAFVFGPTEALLGLVDANGGVPLKWTHKAPIPDGIGGNLNHAIDVKLNNKKSVTVHVTENPKLGDTEEWEIYNFTADAHPIHLHLVRFEVIERRGLNDAPGTGSSVGGAGAGSNGILPSEAGFKDTVISYPGEITVVKAKFDLEGLYVWHCHIVEHEDNEMMRPYAVTAEAKPHKYEHYKFRKEYKKRHHYLWGKKGKHPKGHGDD